MNEVAYEVWRGAMYCVGVFVTCNVGGAALRTAAKRVSGLMNPHEETPEGTSVKAANDLQAVVSGFAKGMNAIAESMGTVVTFSEAEAARNGGGSGQERFDDMQRQIGADAKRDNAETETVTPS